jgi:hypothetical protein
VVEGTPNRRRGVVVWDAPAVVCVVAAWLLVFSLVWLVAGLASLLMFLAMSWDPGWGWGTVMASGAFGGIPGLILSGILLAIGQHLVDERRWRDGLRRGTAIVHDLRPGDTSSSHATQELTCRLEIRVVGMAPISADYRADIGPLDAPRFVEGASFACEISPELPERVRLWLVADPEADELTGRYRDFRPVQPGRS